LIRTALKGAASAASLTYALAPPSPTNLHNLHIHGRADLALGSNLYGQGLLRGIIEAAGASGLVPIVRGGVTELGSQEQEVKGDDGKPGEGNGANAGGETRPLEYRTNRDQPVFMPVVSCLAVPVESVSPFLCEDFDGSASAFSATGKRVEGSRGEGPRLPCPLG
jgi:hypothetical protein